MGTAVPALRLRSRVAGQLGDAIGERGHGGQIVPRQVRIRHPDPDDAFAVEQQFDERKAINACRASGLFSSKFVPSATRLVRAN